MPVELELELVGKNDVSVERQRKVKIQKYIWDANKAQDYYVFLRKKYLRFLHRPLNLLMLMLKLRSKCLTVLSNSQETV